MIKFLQQKRKAKIDQARESNASPPAKKSHEITKTEPKPPPIFYPPTEPSLPDIDVFQMEGIKNWLHFDVLETSKLEWMKDLPANMPEMKPGEAFEAR